MDGSCGGSHGGSAKVVCGKVIIVWGNTVEIMRSLQRGLLCRWALWGWSVQKWSTVRLVSVERNMVTVEEIIVWAVLCGSDRGDAYWWRGHCMHYFFLLRKHWKNDRCLTCCFSEGGRERIICRATLIIHDTLC